MNKEHLRLREFRKSLGWSQVQMVEFLNKHVGGLATSNYSLMEKGTRAIPLDYIHTLHLKMDLSYDWFFQGVGSRKRESKDKLTITDIGDLKSQVDLLTNKLQTMEKDMKKMYTDFYAHMAKLQA